jgi:TetR/AcrR family transcriptional regulator, tetracycline repressor protein
MRSLARRLGVAPNALYSYVPSKTALIDDLLDELLASVESPSADHPDPVAAIHTMMSSTYDVLTAQPDLVPLYLARQGARGPNAVALGEVLDALLARAGVEPAAVALARRVLIIHTIGSAAFAVGDTDLESPIPQSVTHDSFRVSLTWMIAGIISGASGLAEP